MRTPTEEQKAKAAEKRANMRALAAKISKMTDAERAALAAKLPGVVTIEGRALSPHNQMMLAFQGEFTVVGGFQQWKRAGRVVMKGQRGACIWFPLGDRKQDGTEDTTGAGEEKSSCRFGLATVFDVKQTEDLAEANARRDAETVHLAEHEGWTALNRMQEAPLALPAPAQSSPDWSDIAYEDSCREACGL
jgi:N-terminal domain of anti-restriction factor ArdC